MKNRLVRWIIYIVIGIGIGTAFGYFKNQKNMDEGVIALSPDATENNGIKLPTRVMESLSTAKETMGKAMEDGKNAIDGAVDAGQEAVDTTLNAGQDVIGETIEAGKSAVDATLDAGKNVIGEATKSLQDHHGIEATTTATEAADVTIEAETVIDEVGIDVEAVKDDLTPMPNN